MEEKKPQYQIWREIREKGLGRNQSCMLWNLHDKYQNRVRIKL